MLNMKRNSVGSKIEYIHKIGANKMFRSNDLEEVDENIILEDDFISFD